MLDACAIIIEYIKEHKDIDATDMMSALDLNNPFALQQLQHMFVVAQEYYTTKFKFNKLLNKDGQLIKVLEN